ncbi:MAG: translation initiation factor IF-3 [bacterium]|nr:translation initiation factor IF-3 [bacterium]
MNRINDKITSPEVRVIDETGANVGVLKTSDALLRAKEKGLDLVEVSPDSKPPVVKIINFDKYRYQEKKKQQKQKVQQKQLGWKQVQISVREARHDLDIKAGKVNEFLGEGNPVEIQLTLRGREKAHKDFAKRKLEEFLKIINPEHKILSEIKYGGRGFNVQITKR